VSLMGMMLAPLDGKSWLSVDQVVARLEAEFERVTVTPGEASKYAEGLAAKYRATGQSALADRLEAGKSEGRTITITDGEPDRVLFFMVLPQFPIMAAFKSEEHLSAIQPFLERCSRALGYPLR